MTDLAVASGPMAQETARQDLLPLGWYVRQQREARGWSGTELAARASAGRSDDESPVGRSTIHRLEHGYRITRPGNLASILVALEIEFSEVETLLPEGYDKGLLAAKMGDVAQFTPYVPAQVRASRPSLRAFLREEPEQELFVRFDKGGDDAAMLNLVRLLAQGGYTVKL